MNELGLPRKEHEEPIKSDWLTDLGGRELRSTAQRAEEPGKNFQSPQRTEPTSESKAQVWRPKGALDREKNAKEGRETFSAKFWEKNKVNSIVGKKQSQFDRFLLVVEFIIVVLSLFLLVSFFFLQTFLVLLL